MLSLKHLSMESNFSVGSDMENSKLIRNSPNKSCELDPIPT
jgi:hypothetical protein